MGPHGAWITEDNMKLQKYIAWTGVFAYDTVAFGHGELAYLKHEFQRIPFTPANHTVAHGHGPSKAISMGMGRLYIWNINFNVYHLNWCFGACKIVAYGHGAK